jgi:hypothetical protein
MQPPYLTDAEIAEICAPLRQGAAQIKLLRSWGVRVAVKPNGRPLVWRADVERRPPEPPAGRDTVRASNEPNWNRRA